MAAVPLNRRHVLGAAAAAVLGVAGASRAQAASAATTGPFGCAPRYLGYQGADLSTPWASYFTGTTLPVQLEVQQAFDGPPTPAADIPPRAELAAGINRDGYSTVETGYGQRSGVVWAAARTQMPGVTAQMWDWWFGWHLPQASRYKLWHPDAHAFASITEPPRAAPVARKAYIGKVSYVDEYIGPYLEQLAIRFMDPASAGLRTSDGTTVIYGRVGSAVLPLDLGWLCHQVRAVSGGSEMRSRFYLNVPGVHAVDGRQTTCALARGPLETLRTPLPFNAEFGRQLMQHCGAEMNHLASFLPRLYAEFKDTP